MINLDDMILLRRANVFKLQKDNADILPIVYGAHNVGGTFGLVKTVEIEENYAYLISDCPIHSIQAVYDGDNQEITTGFTTYTNGSYKGIGNIAFIHFDSIKPGREDDFPFTKPFTVRCVGKINSEGQLIENPIDIIKDFLISYAGWTEDNFDITSISDSFAKLELNKYKMKWYADNDVLTRTFILELCSNFFGNMILRKRRLHVYINPFVDKVEEANIQSHFTAFSDCVGGDSGVSYEVSIDNIITKVRIEFNYDWLNSKYLNYIEEEDSISIQSFSTPKTKLFQLKGLKSSGIARQLARYLLRQYSTERGIYTFDIKRFRAFNLKFGSLISLCWTHGPKSYGHRSSGMINEVLKVLDVSFNANDGQATVKAIETLCFLSDDWIADATILANATVTANPARRLPVH